MKTHKLKILPEYMTAQLIGIKSFEIRKNDRDFKPGDRLLLREWINGHYTKRQTTVCVTYITDYEQKPGYVVLGTSAIGSTSAKTIESLMD